MDSYYQLSNSWSSGSKGMLYTSEYPMGAKVFHDVAMNNICSRTLEAIQVNDIGL